MRANSVFRFLLYVAGRSPNSMLALENLRALCREHVPDHHIIEVVDVLREPQRAMNDGILVTPTLLRVAPTPVVQIIGNLAHTDLVTSTLGLRQVLP